MKPPSIKVAYLVWVALVVIATSYGLSTGSYQESMSLAVDKAEPLPDGLTYERALQYFIVISLGAAVVAIVALAFLVWSSARRKRWSIWLLSFAAVWQAFDSINGVYHLQEMYPGTIGAGDWVIGAIGSLIWLYILYAVQKLRVGGNARQDAP